MDGSILNLWVKTKKKMHLLLNKKCKDLHYMAHLMSFPLYLNFRKGLEV